MIDLSHTWTQRHMLGGRGGEMRPCKFCWRPSPSACVLFSWLLFGCLSTIFLSAGIPNPTWELPDSLALSSSDRTAAGFSIATAITSGLLLLYFLTTFLNTSETVFSMWAKGQFTGQLESAAWAALWRASKSFPLSSHRQRVVILIFPFKLYPLCPSVCWGRKISMLQCRMSRCRHYTHNEDKYLIYRDNIFTWPQWYHLMQFLVSHRRTVQLMCQMLYHHHYTSTGIQD